MGCSNSKTASDVTAPVAAQPAVTKVAETVTAAAEPVVELVKPVVEVPVSMQSEDTQETAPPTPQKEVVVALEKVEETLTAVKEDVPAEVAAVVAAAVETVKEEVAAVETVKEEVAPVEVAAVEVAAVEVAAVEVAAVEVAAVEAAAVEVAAVAVAAEVEAPVVVEEPKETMSAETKVALDAAVDAQKALLGYVTDPLFKSHGKSGAVNLSARPPTDEEKQVVAGKMSFGKLFTIKQISEFIMDISGKGKWDNMFESGKDLETLITEENRGLRIAWAAYKKQMGVAGRDFVYSVMWEQVSEDKIVISTRSMDLKAYPEGNFMASHCRGTILNAGYVLETVDGEAMVTFFNQTDVGGSVPTWIVNRVTMKQPANLTDICAAMKKKHGK